MLVHHFLERSAERSPDKVALILGESRYSYADLDEKSDRIANGLITAGVRPGDRVAVHLPNSLEAVVSVFAVLKAGAAFVMIHPTVKADKMAFILRDAGIRCMILPSAKAGRLEPHLAGAGIEVAVTTGDSRPTGAIPQVAWSEILDGHDARRPAVSIALTDLAALIYTSGSTGEPKGVVCGHDNVVFASGSIIKYLENRPDDVVINVLPFSFDYGLYQLLMVFRFGGTLVLESGFAYPSVVAKRIAEHHVTGFPGVPTVFATLLQLDLNRYDFGSLRYLTNTAAALPVSHIERLRNAFPNARLFSMYGLTECKRALYLPPEELGRRPGSVGIPIPGTRAWLEDEEANRLPPGDIGELVVQGPHVMRGYWNRPEASKRFQDAADPEKRSLLTGDLLRQDDEGFFYFVARRDDIIKSRGEKVAPKEIENVLYSLEGVTEASVVGVPDPILGEAIKALVVVNGAALTPQEILRHCRLHLEDFMVPQIIELRDGLPKTASGKISRVPGGV